MKTWEVLLLNKAVYGLVDGVKKWFMCFAKAMEQSGWLTIGLGPAFGDFPMRRVKWWLLP